MKLLAGLIGAIQEAPRPRYRIYTDSAHYRYIAGELLRGWASDDSSCQALERRLAGQLGTAHTRCVPQNRVGIYLAVRALVRPGRKVILSPYTLSDVINMVVCAGAIPVFADVETESSNIDPDAVEALIDDETDAVLVTHLHGLICDIPRLKELCERHDLRLLEDAAQAFGARQNGEYAGTFGDAGVFSFGMYKNVNAFYGGLVVTPHADLAESISAELRAWPRQHTELLRKAAHGLATDLATWPPVFRFLTYPVFRHAYLNDIKWLNRQVTIEDDIKLKTALPTDYQRRMSPAQARIVLHQLDSVEQNMRQRIAAAEIYHEGLSDIEELGLPPLLTDGSHGYLHYPLRASQREDLTRFMVRHGRDVAVQHLTNCASEPAFAKFARPCPKAAQVAARTMLLSTYPRYGLEQVRANVATIRRYFLGAD